MAIQSDITSERFFQINESGPIHSTSGNTYEIQIGKMPRKKKKRIKKKLAELAAISIRTRLADVEYEEIGWDKPTNWTIKNQSND